MSETRGLVGREVECHVLERTLDRIGGTAHVIEITGAPGIGKTRLLAELSQRAAQRGLMVLTAQASEPARPVPFALVIDALSECIDAPGRRRRRLGARDDIGRLGGVLQSVRRQWGGRTTTAGPAERHRIGQAVRGLLERLAGSGLVLLLDDLHWADEESLELLGALVRRPPRGPVLIALAYRERQAPARLLAALATADGDPPVERLRLAPLGPGPAEALLGHQGTRSWRQALHRESGGNPFYLRALAGSTTRVADGRPESPSRELPTDARAALLAELRPLSATARIVLEAAAVCGDPFDPELAADVARIEGQALLDALDELAERDLVRPVHAGLQLTFRHDLVRQTVHDASRAGWRLGAHARAAAALERRGAPAVARAPHVERVAGLGDRAAAALLADAARAVGSRSPATAARWLRRALEVLPDTDGDRPARVELHQRLGIALGVAGHPRASRDVLHEALRLLPVQAAAQRTRAVVFCARMERLLGRTAEALALLVGELARLPDPGSPEAATLRVELACVEYIRHGLPASLQWATGALADARRHGLRPLRPVALGLIAMTRCVSGDVEAARAAVDEAAALLDGLLDSELSERLDAAIWVGWAEVQLQRQEAALRHLDRALALARGSGQGSWLPQLLAVRVLVLRVAGRLAEAAECADDAVDVTLVTGWEEQRAAAFAMRSWVAMWTGDLEEAVGDRVSADEEAAETASGWFVATAAPLVAEARLLAGDPDGCLALVDGAGGPALPLADAWSRVGWYELLTRAELARGDVTAAAVWADRARQAAARFELSGRRGLALLARAQVEAARRPAAGLEAATGAVEALSEAGMALDAARARLLVAGALAARGDSQEAAAALRMARLMSESVGATLLTRQAVSQRRRLAALAPRVREAGRHAGLAALTSRERQVGDLVTEGLSNREIAARLHVTDKTVEMHVSNVLAKLSVPSRAAAASVIARAPFQAG